ncbi:glycerate kinase [Brevibacillus ginsengisoli]|uniref:glycerate kinase n=1 Tax=Brevibacillus ginsengisoli TaxID=363854 RepID=UPI003CF37287
MKILVAPDSYKGSLTSIEVGRLVKEAFRLEFPEATIVVIPMADGGEGTLDALIDATNGKRVDLKVTGPLRELVHTHYGILGDGQTAVIEVASIAGLPMVPHSERNPLVTTTRGVGEAILHAMDLGYRQFVIGLGGSATNDAGLGMLQVLGADFRDDQGHEVESVGGSLAKVKTVDLSRLDERLHTCAFRVATDVKNPLCGKLGASHVFAPQKGASPDQVEQMDSAMSHFAHLIESHAGKSLQNQPGAGAAGGLGFAFILLGGKLIPGAQLVAEAAGLEAHVQQCDWVITGEGQSDYQTVFGKVPYYIGQLAKQANKRAILLSGSLGEGASQLHELFVSLHSIAPGPISLEDSMKHGATYITQAARNIARLIKAASRRNDHGTSSK